MVGAARWGLLVVAVAVACACAALAPAAYASLGVPHRRSAVDAHRLRGIDRPARWPASRRLAGGADNGTTSRRAGQRISPRDMGQIAVDGSDPGSTVIVPGPGRSSPRPAGSSRGGSSSGPRSRCPTTASSRSTRARRSPRSARQSLGAVQLRHGRVRRGRAGRPREHTDPGADARTRGRLPERQRGHRPRSSTTTATSSLGTVARPAGYHVVRRPAVSRMPLSRASSSRSAAPRSSAGTAPRPPAAVRPGPRRATTSSWPSRGPRCNATAGVPISPVLDTFTESTRAHVRADDRLGRRNPDAPARSSPRPAGRWRTGTHAYAEAGNYNAVVTVDDASGPTSKPRTR